MLSILALIALFGALWLAIVNTKLANENESYERILNEYAKWLSHEKGLREQAEEAVIRAQEEQSQLLAKTRNTSTVSNTPKRKVGLVEALEMVDERELTPKPRKLGQSGSKKFVTTPSTSRKLKAKK